MKDRELTRLLQAHPEEGLEAAMLEYAPLVKGILCRILPQNPCDREECMADVSLHSGAAPQNWRPLAHRCAPGWPSRRATAALTATTRCAAARR